MCLPARAILTVGRFLGRRGAFLLCMGVAWICYGSSILVTRAPAAQKEGLTALTAVVPLHSWGWVWVASGIIGAAFCCVQHVGADQIGFTTLVVPASAWSAGYLIDWIVVGEYSRGWIVSVTYAALSAAVVIAGGWPEVRKGSGGNG